MLRCSVLNLEFGESYSECPVQLWYSGFSRPALIQLYSGLLCFESILKGTWNCIQSYAQVPQVKTSTCKYPEVPERYNFTQGLRSDLIKLYSAQQRPLSTVTTIHQQICTPLALPLANFFISSFPSNQNVIVFIVYFEQIWWEMPTF